MPMREFISRLKTKLASLRGPQDAGQHRVRDMSYRAFVEQAENGVVLAYVATGQLIDANPALLRRAGFAPADLARLKLDDLFCEGAGNSQSLTSQLQSAETGSMLLWREKRSNGTLVDTEVRCTVVEFDGEDVLALVMHDVSVRKKIETQLLDNQQRLDHLAHHDQLTGLPNRHFLSNFLPRALEQCKNASQQLGILFIDLDHFKNVNDSRGHEVGDRLLQEVARRITAECRASDTVVRMGGDEFVVILQGVGANDQVLDTARRINRALDLPIKIAGHKMVTTASIGVSLFPRDGKDMGELLKHSDSAMYLAKETGRNKFQVFRTEIKDKINKRAALEAGLRAAMKLNQFDVYYQPIIELQTNRVAGLEALVRWIHPTRGVVAPGEFIEVAEDSGLIVVLGNMVLRQVMQDLQTWKTAGLPLVPISINISPVQLSQGDLANVVRKLLAASGFEADAIELELTERAMFVASNAMRGDSKRDMIAELRDSGLRIAIDDFGTGYSSLSYLKQWRVDKLKIDRRFIRDLGTDMNDLAIVSAILAIARQMRIAVVAEGIEAYQQVQKLIPLGCQFGQGFLFAEPQPAEKCLQFLKSSVAKDTSKLTDSGRMRVMEQSLLEAAPYREY